MKYIVLMVAVTLLGFTTFSNVRTVPTKINQNYGTQDSSAVAADLSAGKFVKNIETPPVFPGGERALQLFFDKHLNYEKLDVYSGVETVVHLSLVIQKDGRISNFNVLNGDAGVLDEELLKTMKLMPKWEPGKNEKGKTDHTLYKFQIRLKFPSRDDQEDVTFFYAPPPETDEEISEQEELIVDFAEEEPYFPSGIGEMEAFIKKNINPDNIKTSQRTSGIVYVQFVVRKTGELTNIKVIRGINDGVDAEAIRIIEIMPNWIPAKQAGKVVNCRFTLPIRLDF